MKSRTIAFFVLLSLLIATRGAVITWTNVSGGSWQTAANWSPNQIPGVADTAQITTDGTYNITLASDVTVTAFTIGAPAGTQTITLTGRTLKATTTGMVAGNGVLMFQDGSLQGNVTVAIAGSIIFSGTASKSLYSLTLINNGTVQWLGGTLQLGSTPTSIITNNGLWETKSDSTLYQAIGGPAPQFVNNGTFRKSAGAQITSISNIHFENAGTTEVQTGTLQLGSMQDMVVGGTFTVSPGAAVNFANGSFIESGATFGGGGTSKFNGGTLTLVNDQMAGLTLAGGDIKLAPTFQAAGSINSLILSGSRLTGTNEVAGTLTLLDGGITGMLTVRSGGALTFSTAPAKTLYALTLINNGTVNWLGGLLQMGATPTTLITNNGLWDIKGDDTIYIGQGGPTPVFTNTGTVRKSAGSGISNFSSMQLINSGTVDAQSGTIQFSNASNMILGGTFSASAGATLQLANGTFTENAASFTGAGNLKFTSGTLTLVNDKMNGLSLSGGSIVLLPTFQNAGAINDLTLNGSVLTGTNEISGTLTVVDGGITGQITVRSGANLIFQGSASKTLYSLAFINNGTVQWRGGLLQCGATPATLITNNSLWEISGDDTMYLGVGGPTNVFNNLGTVRKISGSGITTFSSLQFINAGTVEAQTATIQFNNMLNMTLGGSFVAQPGATIQLAGGTYTANGATFGGGGALKMTSGTLTLGSDILPGLTLAGGNLNLTSTFQGGSITNLTMSGSTLSGANEVTGTLTMLDGSLQGQLTVAPSGTLTFSSSAAKTLYSLTLINNGKVRWLGGALQMGSTPTTVITNAGLWEISGNDTIYLGVGGPTPQFINTGTIRKINGSAISQFSNMYFANSGTVDVQIGTIQFTSTQDMGLGGTFTTTAGANFILANGNFTENGATFTGTGSSRMTGGTLTLVNDKMNGLELAGGDITLGPAFQSAGAIMDLTLAGARLTETNEIAGTLTLTSGGVIGDLTVRSGGTLALSTSGGKTFYQLNLHNKGTVKWQGGTIQLGATPTSIINNEGLWEISSDDTIYQGIGGPTPQLLNTGTIRKISGAGISQFNGMHFENSGLVESLSGTIQFNAVANMLVGGTFGATAGATVQLAGGTFTENGAIFSGAGSSKLTGGTLAFVTDKMPGLLLAGGTIQIGNTFQSAGAITDLALNGATLVGTNEVAGTLTIVDGAVEGKLTVRPNATLAINGNAAKSFYKTTLNNNGKVVWQGGSIQLGATPTSAINNAGVWEVNSDEIIYQAIGGPTPVFSNTGVFRKIGGSETTRISGITFENSGMVEVQAGTVQFPNNYTHTVGTIRLAGGRIEAQGLLTMQSGTLDGSGSVGSALFNGGAISPGVNGPGKITFALGLKLTTGVTVAIDAQTSTPGTGYDQLAVIGTTDLGGATLQVANVAPLLVGARLTIIDNDGIDPVIGTFSLKPEGNLFQVDKQLFRIRYASGSGNDVVLIRDDGGVRLTAIRYLANGTFQLSGLGTNNGVYTISATTDYTTWTELGSTTANGGGLFLFDDTNAVSFPNRFYQSFGPGIDVP